MTREEILAMKPGRELNALVAEHVFGWRKEKGPTTDYDGSCESFDVLVPPNIDNPFSLFPPQGVIKPWWFCREWSTDISAAWEVVEKLNKNSKFLKITQQIGTGIYFVAVLEKDPLTGYYSDECWTPSESLPEAICKVAILACLEA